MTCRDFERAWNELIDAEAGGKFERARRWLIRSWRSASVCCGIMRPSVWSAAR